MKDNAYAALVSANTNRQATTTGIYTAFKASPNVYKPVACCRLPVGAASRARTHDILITGQALYQLSYDSTEHNLIIQQRTLCVQP